MSELNILKASAGSGKTFSLTLAYFRIIFRTPSEFRNILAVTFTNKATEEMKSRIISELDVMAEGRPSSYAPVLMGEFGFSADELKNKAEKLRKMLLHDYGRISITTIDRFFQRLIKAFTKELGIFPGYNVELDSDYVLLRAVDRLMGGMRENRVLYGWIADLVNSNVDEGKSWSVKSKMADLGLELFKENYMLFDSRVQDKFDDKGFLTVYRDFLQAIIRQYEEGLKQISREAIDIIEKNGLLLQDFKNNKSGCAAHFYKLKARKYDELTKTARAAVDDISYWYTKTTPEAIKVKIEAAFPALNELLKQAVDTYDRQCKYYLSARLITDNLYQLGILNDLYRQVREYCEENGLMLLSDTTRILNLLIAGNDTSFLYEKAGIYYKHLMIDEFQDTSALQWRNFRPLITNTLSNGDHALIVGDVKQSIYRWRNGDWSLLAEGVEKELARFGTDVKTLKNNWRSSPEIVGFNNRFFQEASVALQALYEGEEGENKQWGQAIGIAYEQLEQKPESTSPGYVDVSFVPVTSKEDEALVMEQVVDILNDIVDRGGMLKEIVILVRNGKEGAFVANYLMEYNESAARRIGFISNDSLYIQASPYVKFILSVLKYIVDPFDAVNKAAALLLYFNFIHKGVANANEIFRLSVEKELFECLNSDFSAASGEMMAFSLFETVEAIIDRFGLKEREEEVAYLIAFQDVIFEYENNNSNSIPLFLEWWEKEKNKKVLATSEETDAVRILTIHKSKGLEFGHVILPFCSWELDAVRPVRRVWCETKEEGFDAVEYVPLNYSSKLADTVFSDSYYEEHLKSYVDSLNLLYVSLTRAKRELYIRPYLPKMNKENMPVLSDIGAFIYQILMQLGEDAELGSALDGEMNLKYGKKQALSVSLKKEQACRITGYPVYDLEERIRVKYRYADYAIPADIEGSNVAVSAVDEGKLLHEIFRSIRHHQDVEPAVRSACSSGLLSKDDKVRYINEIEDYISRPEVKDWFTEQYKVINERDILFPTATKVRPDRVMVDNTGKAVVVDYKFGRKEENKYLKQVGFYCSVIRQMGYREVEGYVWYVNLEKIIKV